jgi:hypothetical protein
MQQEDARLTHAAGAAVLWTVVDATIVLELAVRPGPPGRESGRPNAGATSRKLSVQLARSQVAEVLVRSETAHEVEAVARSVSDACQDELIPGSLPPADLSRSGGNEPDLGKHPLRGNVLIASRGSEHP